MHAGSLQISLGDVPINSFDEESDTENYFSSIEREMGVRGGVGAIINEFIPNRLTASYRRYLIERELGLDCGCVYTQLYERMPPYETNSIFSGENMTYENETNAGPLLKWITVKFMLNSLFYSTLAALVTMHTGSFRVEVEGLEFELLFVVVVVVLFVVLLFYTTIPLSSNDIPLINVIITLSSTVLSLCWNLPTMQKLFYSFQFFLIYWPVCDTQPREQEGVYL